MAATHSIAVLTADALVGSAFPKPILITRVIARPSPKLYDVFALARSGGFKARYVDLDVGDDETLAEALFRLWQDQCGGRPTFVEIATGALYVTRVEADRPVGVTAIGNLYDAFGGRPIGETVATYATTFFAWSETSAVAAILDAKSDIDRDAAAAAFRTRTPIAMTAAEILRTLIAAISQTAARYASAAGGNGDGIERARRSDGIDRYTFA